MSYPAEETGVGARTAGHEITRWRGKAHLTRVNVRWSLAQANPDVRKCKSNDRTDEIRRIPNIRSATRAIGDQG